MKEEKAYTVVIGGRANMLAWGTTQRHVMALSPEAAGDAAKSEVAMQMGDSPDGWNVVAIYAGHLTDLNEKPC